MIEVRRENFSVRQIASEVTRLVDKEMAESLADLNDTTPLIFDKRAMSISFINAHGKKIDISDALSVFFGQQLLQTPDITPYERRNAGNAVIIYLCTQVADKAHFNQGKEAGKQIPDVICAENLTDLLDIIPPEQLHKSQNQYSPAKIGASVLAVAAAGAVISTLLPPDALDDGAPSTPTDTAPPAAPIVQTDTNAALANIHRAKVDSWADAIKETQNKKPRPPTP